MSYATTGSIKVDSENDIVDVVKMLLAGLPVGALDISVQIKMDGLHNLGSKVVIGTRPFTVRFIPARFPEQLGDVSLAYKTENEGQLELPNMSENDLETL